MAKVPHPTGIHVPEFVTVALDTQFTPALRGFRCGASGDVAIIDTSGVTRTITNVQTGESVRGGIQQILTSGTTVTNPTVNLVGLG